jgi:hypothetical protein
MAARVLSLALCVSVSHGLQLARSVRPSAAVATGASRVLPAMLLGMGGEKSEVPRTVGEAKAAYQAAYGKPTPTLAQGFVGELLTSVTLATVHPTYEYTRVLAVGYEALCDSFLVAISDEARRKELHDCMCTALELDADQIKADSDALKAQAAGMSEADFLGLPELKALAGQKYSYPIGAGLLTLMPVVEGGATPTAPMIERWATALGVSELRLSKDWMFFEKALKSMADARTMMIEMQAAAKRKEAKALAEKADKAAKAAEAAQA